MKRLVKWIGWIVVVLVVVVIGFVGYVYTASNRQMAATYTVTAPAITIPSDPASIARGKYLVERVSMCVECHGADLGGKVVEENFAMGRLVSANLTRGRGGIGGRYTDRDYVRTLLHGVKPDGHSLVFMPTQDYRFTETALGSIIAYVKSVPPVDRDLGRPAPGPMARALGLFTDFPLSPAAKTNHASVAFAAPKDLTNPVAAGEEIVAMAACRSCHGGDFTGGGGPPPGGANITPVGIGSWSERDFITAIREHKRPNGSTISDAMPRGYGQMADTELQHVYAYLKTVPAKGEKTKSQR